MGTDLHIRWLQPEFQADSLPKNGFTSTSAVAGNTPVPLLSTLLLFISALCVSALCVLPLLTHSKASFTRPLAFA